LRILVERGLDPNAQDDEGKTALFFTHFKYQWNCVIKVGASVNVQDRDGNLPQAPALSRLSSIEDGSSEDEYESGG
jgi:hypothetical protein